MGNYLLKAFNQCKSVRSYENKRYVVMRILSIRTATIYVFDVKYPFTIKWNDLKEIHSEITFCKNKNGKLYLTITLPLREVIDIVDCNKLSRFINKYINY